jgi:myo-inositol-1(or 4)-monophosphatase
MRDGFGQVSVSATKGRGNVLTETDLAVEAATLGILRDAFPSHSILSEESAADTRSDGWLWVVDPIDGTKNFSRGIPHFCFSIALCWQGEPVVGLVSHPLLDQEIAAVKGEGCTVNGVPAAVTTSGTVYESVVAIDLGYDDVRAAMQLEVARRLWPGMQSLRVMGSAALGLAYVAAGRWDIFLHADLQPWDLAAGLLLVREAGGVVMDRDGNHATILSPAVVASNSLVYSDFVRLAGDLPWNA